MKSLTRTGSGLFLMAVLLFFQACQKTNTTAENQSFTLVSLLKHEVSLPKLQTEFGQVTVGQIRAVWPVSEPGQEARDFDMTPTQHLTSGPDISKYVPAGYTSHITSGPDISKYLPAGYNSHIENGPDMTKYLPEGYDTHIEEGPDKTKYLPQGYTIHITSGPDISKYTTGRLGGGRFTVEQVDLVPVLFQPIAPLQASKHR